MSTMPKAVGDVVAERVREYRRARHMNIQQLSERCAELGAPSLTAASLTNIERRPTGADRQPGWIEPDAGGKKVRTRRSVSVEELLVLAQALQVPPALLLVPVGQRESILVTPVAEVGPFQGWQWIVGEQPLDEGDSDRQKAYDEAAESIMLARRFMSAVDSLDAVTMDLVTDEQRSMFLRGDLLRIAEAREAALKSAVGNSARGPETGPGAFLTLEQARAHALEQVRYLIGRIKDRGEYPPPITITRVSWIIPFLEDRSRG